MSKQVQNKPTDPAQALVAHGLDFVVDAVRRMRDFKGNEREARYVILHLATGAELLLKSRVYREHWSLVFERPEAAVRRKLLAGDFKSVGPE